MNLIHHPAEPLCFDLCTLILLTVDWLNANWWAKQFHPQFERERVDSRVWRCSWSSVTSHVVCLIVSEWVVKVWEQVERFFSSLWNFLSPFPFFSSSQRSGQPSASLRSSDMAPKKVAAAAPGKFTSSPSSTTLRIHDWQALLSRCQPPLVSLSTSLQPLAGSASLARRPEAWILANLSLLSKNTDHLPRT